MDDLTFIVLKIVVTIATALITSYLIPLIRAKLNGAKYAILLATVDIAVRAAEQTLSGEYGQVKKDVVVKYITDWMIAHGISITQNQLDQIIEAAVYSIHNEG